MNYLYCTLLDDGDNEFHPELSWIIQIDGPASIFELTKRAELLIKPLLSDVDFEGEEYAIDVELMEFDESGVCQL